MIVPDVNLLLYAHVAGFAEHAKARRWWESLMNGDREVGLGAPALFGFVRLATSSQVFDRPPSVGEALRHVEEWLSRPHVRFAVPGPQHQGELHSNDADFARFPSLRWVNPLR